MIENKLQALVDSAVDICHYYETHEYNQWDFTDIDKLIYVLEKALYQFMNKED